MPTCRSSNLSRSSLLANRRYIHNQKRFPSYHLLYTYITTVASNDDLPSGFDSEGLHMNTKVSGLSGLSRRELTLCLLWLCRPICLIIVENMVSKLPMTALLGCRRGGGSGGTGSYPGLTKLPTSPHEPAARAQTSLSLHRIANHVVGYTTQLLASSLASYVRYSSLPIPSQGVLSCWTLFSHLGGAG